MNIQQILAQLSGMGFDGDFSNITSLSNLTSTDIMNQMEQTYDVQGMLSPDMFQTLNPNLLSSTLRKSYSPVIEASNQSLLGDLINKTQGQRGVTAAGGFSGSGGFQDFSSEAKDVYGKKALDAFQMPYQKQQQALSSIGNILQDWNQRTLDITSPEQ
tara:strand:- start:228 stop:701 length:474 start_codon:yes stop_codon:yes gene_type:complete